MHELPDVSPDDPSKVVSGGVPEIGATSVYSAANVVFDPIQARSTQELLLEAHRAQIDALSSDIDPEGYTRSMLRSAQLTWEVFKKVHPVHVDDRQRYGRDAVDHLISAGEYRQAVEIADQVLEAMGDADLYYSLDILDLREEADRIVRRWDLIQAAEQESVAQ